MIFQQPKLEFRRKLLVLAGAKIDVTEPATGQLVGYIKMKAFKLREDIKLFTDSSQTTLLLSIQARQIIDFGATYDVRAPNSENILFSLQRKGLRSTFVRDKWLILDPTGNEYGYYEETGTYALFRRYIAFIPILGETIDIIFFFMSIDYKLYVTTSSQPQQAATITRRKNPFIIKYASDSTTGDAQVDNRIIVAATAMLTVIEVGKN